MNEEKYHKIHALLCLQLVHRAFRYIRILEGISKINKAIMNIENVFILIVLEI